MRWLAFSILAFSSLATVCPTAIAQAAAEYGLGAGQAATTGATARKLGTSLSDLFGTASKGVQQDQVRDEPAPSAPGVAAHKPTRTVRPKRSTALVTKKPAASAPSPATQEATQPSPVPPAPRYEDPPKIQAGIGYDELVRRFGPPSMSITTGPNRSMLLYSSGGTSYQVEVEDGKVIASRPE